MVSAPLKGAPDIAGVMGTSNTGPVLDRDFAKNRTLYYGYTTAPPAKGEPYVGKILKAKLSADGTASRTPRPSTSSRSWRPAGIVQARDGTLLIASAEVADRGPNPQSMTDPRGKVLRIAADGSIPKDNPFLKDAAANPALYAVGFRDIQGAALNPATGELWVGENEPMGGDELNRIKPGGNYGFPEISYGRQQQRRDDQRRQDPAGRHGAAGLFLDALDRAVGRRLLRRQGLPGLEEQRLRGRHVRPPGRAPGDEERPCGRRGKAADGPLQAHQGRARGPRRRCSM